MKAIDVFEKKTAVKKLPAFRVGDTLKVHLRVKEGEKTRIQIFEGVCIRRRGTGVSASFTVIKETHGDIVEKVFPIYSPTVEKVTITHKGKAHRAKLYHLRKK